MVITPPNINFTPYVGFFASFTRNFTNHWKFYPPIKKHGSLCLLHPTCKRPCLEFVLQFSNNDVGYTNNKSKYFYNQTIRKKGRYIKSGACKKVIDSAIRKKRRIEQSNSVQTDEEHTWIFWQEKNFACYHGTYLLVSSFIQHEDRGWVKGVEEGIDILVHNKFYFVRDHENLV